MEQPKDKSYLNDNRCQHGELKGFSVSDENSCNSSDSEPRRGLKLRVEKWKLWQLEEKFKFSLGGRWWGIVVVIFMEQVVVLCQTGLTGT